MELFWVFFMASERYKLQRPWAATANNSMHKTRNNASANLLLKELVRNLVCSCKHLIKTNQKQGLRDGTSKPNTETRLNSLPKRYTSAQIPVSLSVYLSICPSVDLSIDFLYLPSIFLYLSMHRKLYLHIHIHIYIYTYIHIYIYTHT